MMTIAKKFKTQFCFFLDKRKLNYKVRCKLSESYTVTMDTNFTSIPSIALTLMSISLLVAKNYAKIGKPPNLMLNNINMC